METSIEVSHDWGSPPLTREQPARMESILLRFRITPAYAGTTLIVFLICSLSRDHPRLRGNNLLCLFSLAMVVGSPPLTREQRNHGCSMAAFYRITPAYAGTTNRLPFLPLVLRDHPRLRGNNGSGQARKQGKVGSPPLTREQLQGQMRLM